MICLAQMLSAEMLRGSDEGPGSSHPGSHEHREAAVHRYGEGKLRHVIRLRDALIEAYAASPVLFRGD